MHNRVVIFHKMRYTTWSTKNTEFLRNRHLTSAHADGNKCVMLLSLSTECCICPWCWQYWCRRFLVIVLVFTASTSKQKSALTSRLDVPANKWTLPNVVVLKTRHPPNVAVMLAHRLWRWSSITTTLGGCGVFLAETPVLWYYSVYAGLTC